MQAAAARDAEVGAKAQIRVAVVDRAGRALVGAREWDAQPFCEQGELARPDQRPGPMRGDLELEDRMTQPAERRRSGQYLVAVGQRRVARREPK